MALLVFWLEFIIFAIGMFISRKNWRNKLITLLLFPILLPIMIISMLFDIFVSLIRKIVSKFTSTDKENKESRCSEHDKEL